MSKRSLLSILLIVFAALFFSAVIYAWTKIPDVVTMENKAYTKHKKSIVMFSHKKHAEEYKIGCGECHHDAKGKPLTSLKMGDEVKGCIECHKIASRAPKGADLSKKERLAYHAEAIHCNCVGCHKKFKKESAKKTAPTACAKCHLKMKQ
jgi:hypothetical protein